MKTKIISLIAFLWMLSPALAETRVLPPHEPYLGVRSSGMAGAFVSIADDESALFSNPAGIGREDGKESKVWLKGASFPNLTVGANRNPGSTYKAYLDTKGSNQEKIQSALEDMRSHDLTYLRASFFPYFTIGKFQLGYLSDQVIESYLTNLTTAQPSKYSGTYNQKLSILSRIQNGVVSGLSLQHHKLGISLGVAGRLMSRSTMYEDLESSQTLMTQQAADFVSSKNQSSGIAVDAGGLFLLSKVWEPTIGVSVKDVGHTLYRSSGGIYDEVDRMNVVAGMSISPTFGKKVKWLGSVVSFEGHHLNDSRVQIRDKMRIGTELRIGADDITAPLLLRLGHNLRAVSYGATLDLLLFKLDVGSYGEAVDGEEGIRVDRRYLARLSVDLRN